MFTLVLKGTNGCNLRCSYCSVGDKTKVKTVDADRLWEILSFVGELCRDRGEKKLNIIFHGGEPTLIPAESYHRVLERFVRAYPGLLNDLSMQTNGYHLSADMLDLIRTWDIGVGISVDGAPDVHDAQRFDVHGNPTFARISENIDRLRENGIGVACLMVLTRNALGRSYDFLGYYEEKSLQLKINPLMNYGDALLHRDLMLAPGEYAEYLIGMYEYIADRDMSVLVSPLDKLLNAFLNKVPIMDCNFDCNCHKEFIGIDYEGDIYPCGKFADLGQYRVGNVADGLRCFTQSAELEFLHRRRTVSLPEKCCSCRFKKLCHGGCSGGALIQGDVEAETPLCEDYYQLFTYFEKDGLRKLREQLLRRKKQILSELDKSGL